MTTQSGSPTHPPVNQARPRKLWMAAIKPPMYSVAVMPIVLGSAIAYSDTGRLNVGVLALFLLSAILILAWENLSNDVFDAETGIDRNKAHSVVNLTRNKSLVFWISNVCLGLGLCGIGAIALQQRDATILSIILGCCLLGYIYQGPPFRLGYQGLGEILCFFAFGPLAVTAAYYSQAHTWMGSHWAASVILGITTSLILFCSHFHQVEDDLAAGKRSPVVRIGGTARAAQVVVLSTVSVFAIAGVFVALGLFPQWTLLIYGSLPAGIQLCRHVLRHHDQPDRISNSKFVAVNLHFLSGVLLSLGFLL